MSDYLTVTEVARRWKVDRRVVLYWIRDGKLPAANFSPPGRRERWKVRQDDLVKFEESRRNGAVAEKTVVRRRAPIISLFDR